MEHTPTPWRIPANKNLNARSRSGIMIESAPLSNGGGPQYIAEVSGISIEGDSLSNAEFIVRACNSFEELLEACKKLPNQKSLLADAAYTGGDVPKKWINDRGHYNDGYNQALRDVAKLREQAIAKVDNPSAL